MGVKLYQYINLEYLELMADGDMEMKKTMLEMLLDELPNEVAKMPGLYDKSDWDGLHKLSHKLKSTLSFVGNGEMDKANVQIVEISREVTDTSLLPGYIQSMQQFCDKALSELHQEFSKL